MSTDILQPGQGLERRVYPRRYWNAFMSGSLLVHLLVMAMFYNASLLTLFDSGGPQPQAPQPLYVSVAEPEPPKEAVAPPRQPAPRPSAETKAVKAPKPATRKEAPSKETAPVQPASKEARAAEDIQVPPPVPADREEGSVVVIRGTEKTVYAAMPRTNGLQAGRAAAPAGPAKAARDKGVAKDAARAGGRTQEFNMYSTAGKALDIPTKHPPRQDATETGDDISPRRAGLGDLSPGNNKAQERSGDNASGPVQPRLSAVSKADTTAGAMAGELKGAAAAVPGAGRSGPASSAPPRLPDASRALGTPAGQPGQAAPGSALGAGPGGAGSEKRLALAGRTPGPPGGGVQEPRIGPRALGQASQAVLEVPLPSISITSPVDKSEVDAYKDRYVTITGETSGGTFTSVRIRLNSGVYEAPVVSGKFRLQARIDSEENVVLAEGTCGSGDTVRSKFVRFRAANLVTRDIVIKAVYKGEGAAPVLDCRFRPHPLSEKRKPGAPDFRIDNGAGRGFVEVASAVPGIYSIAVRGGGAPGGYCEAVFDVTLYGYDQARKKVRRIGPIRVKGGARACPVRVLMPECVFWDDDGWFTGVLQGGSGTTKYKEPEGIIWKEEE